MKKNGGKYILFFAALTATLVLSLCFSGCGNNYVPIPDYGYEYTKTNIDVTVNKDGTVDVVERLQVQFNDTSHGIIRALPTNSGEKYRGFIASGAKAKYYHENGFLNVRFGQDQVYYHSGMKKDYTLKYTVVLPEVKNDRLLYNLVGSDFDTLHRQVRISVKLPEPFNIAPTVYVGKKGSTDSSRANVTVSEDKKQFWIDVTGKTETAALDAFEAVTVDIGFKKGTFKKAFDFMPLVIAVGGLILFAVILITKLFYARQDKPVPVVTFYPPKDRGGRELSPAQVGALIDNTCSAEDVTSLIFFWASKGCLEIEDGDKDTTLIYKTELDDGAPSYEKNLFKQLFDSGTVDENGEKTVRISSLQERFYGNIVYAQNAVNSEYRGKLYSKSHSGVAVLLSVVTALFAAIAVFVGYFSVSHAWFNFVPFIAVIPAIFLTALGQAIDVNRYKFGKGKRTAISVLYVLLTGAVTALMLLAVPSNVMSVASKVLLGIFACASVSVTPLINKRTKFYNGMLGELIGFRDFLRLAEKDKLEMLLNDNPQYYYDILPYANVLGVSNIWQDKFEQLTMEPPSYYRMTAGDVFTVLWFNRMFNRTRTRCRTVMTSRPQASSGGRSGGGFGRGGGGFSGGGFGGGGSRRW